MLVPWTPTPLSWSVHEQIQSLVHQWSNTGTTLGFKSIRADLSCEQCKAEKKISKNLELRDGLSFHYCSKERTHYSVVMAGRTWEQKNDFSGFWFWIRRTGSCEGITHFCPCDSQKLPQLPVSPGICTNMRKKKEKKDSETTTIIMPALSDT